MLAFLLAIQVTHHLAVKSTSTGWPFFRAAATASGDRVYLLGTHAGTVDFGTGELAVNGDSFIVALRD